MRFTQFLLILSAGAMTVRPVPVNGQSRASHASTAAPISTNAYLELSNRAAFNQNNFFVYLDQDSGFNHGFPSGFFSNGDLSAISIDAGCIDDPADTTTGCYPSADTTVLDETRGTVLRVSFSPLPHGQFAGLNIEEPENWGVLQTGLGYDLAGASSIVFDARAPQIAAFQFGVGQCVTSYMTVPPIWSTLTIPLSSLTPGEPGITCPPNLAGVHVLFSVATNDMNDVNGATVLLDNIHFTPTPARSSQGSETLSLPLSTQTFGVVPQSSNFPPDQVNRNVASIYESALTVLALLHRGQPGDLTAAQAIANALDYALHHDNHGDPLPVAPDGSIGLHNAYESGDIALLNTQQPPKLGQAGDVRLAGFSLPATPPVFYLVLDGATGGNNAFAILALGAAYLQFGNATYLDDARTIGHWITGNLTDTTSTGYGGYYLGYPDLGVPPPKPLTLGKSTENNADIFAAFSLLAAIDSQNAASWNSAANVAGDFVIAMFDPSKGRFYAGTVPPATNPGPGICPDASLTKGNDVINPCDFVDSNSFTTLAMASASRYSGQIDWTRPIQYVLNNFSQTVTAGGLSYQGVDLVPSPVSGSNGIAWEFTGQMVEDCTYIDALLVLTTFQSCAQTYLTQIMQAQASAPFGDGMGLVASTLDGEGAPYGGLPPVDQCLNTPFQCIPERVGLAATNWALVAEQNFSPFPQFATTVSAASGLAPVAAQSIVSIYGGNLAPSATVAGVPPLPTSLGNVRVSITDSSGNQAALPLFYTGPGQINAEIPPGLADGMAQLIVTSPTGIIISPVTLTLVAPGIFTIDESGHGTAAAQVATNLPDGTQTISDVFLCSPGPPVNGGLGCGPYPIDLSVGTSALVLYATGVRNRAALSDVTVQIGGQTLPAAYASAQGQYTGLDQVNVLLPSSLAGSGTVNVQILIAGAASNTVTVVFQ